MVKLHALQMISGPTVKDNLALVHQYLARGDWSNSHNLIVLPECFACFGAGDKSILALAEDKNDGPIQDAISQMAKEFGVWIVAGTLPLKSVDAKRYTASSLLFDEAGALVCEYKKIHLFDVQISDNTKHYQESAYTYPGSEVVVVNTPFGRLGLSVCYDLRFPGLFQAMETVDVIVAPSAFTALTGAAHWNTLIKARAIENTCYLIAANQGGLHQNGRETYGHSQIISPWGTTLCQQETGEGLISASLDFEELKKIRGSIPVGQHNKFRSTLIERC